MANIDGLESLVELNEYGELDRWILTKAREVFGSVKASFDEYDFLKGFATLNNFIINELSGIYMDITKDRLYCDAEDSITRRATQSAMLLISKAMLALVAPVLTYTVDEILDYAPTILKGNMKSVFDLVYEEIPKIELTFDDAILIQARDRLSEIIDKLKKDKIIKSGLELEIIGDINTFHIKTTKDLEDWFIVSALRESSNREKLGSFELEGKIFSIHKAKNNKCPRCWRFVSDEVDEACGRCAEVIAYV